LEHHPDGVRRLRLIGRLRSLLQRLDSTFAEWLDRAALGELLVQPEDQAVRLSSVHGAKGHEWRATWVVGIEEGLMPHYRAVQAAEASGDTSTLDEELRGLYVAVTRARERLCLSACLRRARGDHLEPRLPSRWLHALSSDLIAAA
jgi:superfamily I DNA/RNA helicase